MDTRLLTQALGLLHEDFRKFSLSQHLQTAYSKAQSAGSEPTNTDHQKQFLAAIAALRDALDKANTNDLPISIASVLKQAQLEDLTAPAIRQQLEAILRETPFLLQQAAVNLKGLHDSVTQKWSIAESAINSLSHLGLSADVELPHHEAGILMPEHFSKSDLRILQGQLKQWIQVISTLGELMNGRSPRDIQVTALRGYPGTGHLWHLYTRA